MAAEDKHQGYEWLRLKAKFGHDWILLGAIGKLTRKRGTTLTIIWKEPGLEPFKLHGESVKGMREYIKAVLSKPAIPMDRETLECDGLWVGGLHLSAATVISVRSENPPMCSISWQDNSLRPEHLGADEAQTMIDVLDSISRVYVAGDPTNQQEAS